MRSSSFRPAAVSVFALLAHPVFADDLALVLGTADYRSLDQIGSGTDVVAAAAALAETGYTVVSVADGDTAALDAAVARFAGLVPGADRVIVVLAGHFATDGARTWYLAADSAVPTLASVERGAVSVETLLTLLAEAPGAAVLALGADARADADFDRWLHEGIGTLAIPQGVTVLRGDANRMAAFVENGIAVPGGDLAAMVAGNRRIVADGFLPRPFSFAPAAAATVAIAEPRPVPPIQVNDGAAERALWEGALALDTDAAYANYLQRFPAGNFAEDARTRRAAIAAEPNRAERLAEEALQLSRDDRRNIQRNLTLLQFNTRGIDGIFGPGSRGAITNWQQQNGFSQTGYLTFEQVARIEAQAARRSAEIEVEAERQRQEAIRVDRAYWDETGARGDQPGLRAYLERHPDGLFADAARSRLAVFEDEQRRAALAEDRAAFDAARAADSVPAYQDYLRVYPQGAFVANAQDRIAALSQAQENAPQREAAERAEAALGLNALTARLVEERLAALGLEPGVVDGTFDRETRRAIRRFQSDRQIEPTGFLDEQTVVLLLASALQ